MAWCKGPLEMSDNEAVYRAIAKTGVDVMCVNRPELLVSMLVPARRRRCLC